METHQTRPALLVHPHCLHHLIQDGIKISGLVLGPSGLHLVGIPVHGIALPNSTQAGLLQRLDVLRQVGGHLALPHARDQNNLPPLVVGVELLDDVQNDLRLRRGPHLNPHRVLHPPEELHVGPVQLPRPVPDPQKMGARGVVGPVLLPRQRRLEGEAQPLVGGEKIDALGGGAEGDGAGPHELQGGLQLVDDPRVLLLPLLVLHVVQLPESGLVQAGEPPGHQAPHVVQGGSRVEIGLGQTVSVGLPLGGVNVIHAVSTESQDLLPVHDLVVA
mmetsp:Transcript_3967/g.8138  ORF Transcript_3967/g.8138 Transcript_3967/m.8138 type:complete len:274 (+) Transcript_3967:462-1283(+)